MSEPTKETFEDFTIELCAICSKILKKCKCTEEDRLKHYHALRLKTFGVQTVLIEALTYISMLAKRMEKLENKEEKEL
jgi:hypothetical protein